MRCYKCGQEFACGQETPAAGVSCWCAEFPPLAEVQPGQGCLCAGCLRAALARECAKIDTI